MGWVWLSWWLRGTFSPPPVINWIIRASGCHDFIRCRVCLFGCCFHGSPLFTKDSNKPRHLRRQVLLPLPRLLLASSPPLNPSPPFHTLLYANGWNYIRQTNYGGRGQSKLDNNRQLSTKCRRTHTFPSLIRNAISYLNNNGAKFKLIQIWIYKSRR